MSVNDTQYQVVVHTGSKRGSGLKGGEVYLMLIGDKDTTSERRLPGDKQCFNKNSVDKFWLTGSNVGHLSSIHIRHTGKKGWFLNKIEVVNTNSQLSYIFPFNGWIKKGWLNPATSAVVQAVDVLDSKGNKIDVRSLPSLRLASTPNSEIYNSVVVEPIEESDSSPALDSFGRKMPPPWEKSSSQTPPQPQPESSSPFQTQHKTKPQQQQQLQQFDTKQQLEQEKQKQQLLQQQQQSQQYQSQPSLDDIPLREKSGEQNLSTEQENPVTSSSFEVQKQNSELVTQVIVDDEKDEKNSQDENKFQSSQNSKKSEQIVASGDPSSTSSPIGEGFEHEGFPLLGSSVNSDVNLHESITSNKNLSLDSLDENLELDQALQTPHFTYQDDGKLRDFGETNSAPVLTEKNSSQSNVNTTCNDQINTLSDCYLKDLIDTNDEKNYSLQAIAKNKYIDSKGDVVIDFINPPIRKENHTEPEQQQQNNFFENDQCENSSILSEPFVVNHKQLTPIQVNSDNFIMPLVQSEPIWYKVKDGEYVKNEDLCKELQAEQEQENNFSIKKQGSQSSGSLFYDAEEGGTSLNSDSRRTSAAFSFPFENEVIYETENDKSPKSMSSNSAEPVDHSQLWIENPPDTKTIALIKYYPEVADLGNKYLIIVEMAGVEKSDITYQIISSERVQLRIKRRVSLRLKNRYGATDLLNKHPHAIPDRVYRISVDLMDPILLENQAKVYTDSGLWILELYK